jgi:hypothetical protein
MRYHLAFLLVGAGAGAHTALATDHIRPRDLDPPRLVTSLSCYNVKARVTAVLQPCGVARSGVHPGRAGTILKRCDAPRQKVMQHHHHRQIMAHQVLYPLDHGLEGHVQP